MLKQQLFVLLHSTQKFIKDNEYDYLGLGRVTRSITKSLNIGDKRVFNYRRT
jgi:hypothetical protein